MQLTNTFENKLTDFTRGQGLTLPPNWCIAPLSAASDASVTEIAGSGIARKAVPLSLTSWSSTQGGGGATLASTGTTHATSNLGEIDMGTAADAVGTVTHVGFFDALSAGVCHIWVPLSTPIVTGIGVPLKIPAGAIAFTLGLTGGMSDYLANKMIDRILRGQAYTWPASTWHCALTAPPTNAGGGTEVGGGVGYSRIEIASTLAAWSGTQGPGTTGASTGTSGRSSNNAAVAYADPSGSWGTVTHGALRDAATGGNLLFWAALASGKTVGPGLPLRFQPDSIGITWD